MLIAVSSVEHWPTFNLQENTEIQKKDIHVTVGDKAKIFSKFSLAINYREIIIDFQKCDPGTFNS